MLKSRCSLAAMVAVALTLFTLPLAAQQTYDYRSAKETMVVMVRDYFPGVCTYTSLLIRSDETVGSNLYECGHSNDWNQLAGGSGGGTPGGSMTQVQFN